MEGKYRHEYKYVITEKQICVLRQRLDHVMPLDAHVGSGGFYSIRSLYFDDYDDSCYLDNLNGVDPREKYRIRIYDGNPSRITLECKRRKQGKTLKNDCQLSFDECARLMSGGILPGIAKQHPVLRRLTLGMLQSRMHPVVIVEYDRIPYVYAQGNVRVTIDRNLRSSASIASFLEERIPKRPVMSEGFHLLEVKWDEYLPDVIYRVCQLENLTQTAFSKYCLCRRFHN